MENTESKMTKKRMLYIDLLIWQFNFFDDAKLNGLAKSLEFAFKKVMPYFSEKFDHMLFGWLALLKNYWLLSESIDFLLYNYGI